MMFIRPEDQLTGGGRRYICTYIHTIGVYELLADGRYSLVH
jgi:hypothetical protein